MIRKLLAIIALSISTSVNAASLTYVPLHDFGDNVEIVNDGWSPDAPLIVGSDGDLYSTTFAGSSVGVGTIYKMSPTGTMDPLHAFADNTTVNDGESPVGTVLLARDGNYYGTTANGGKGRKGVVYKMTPAGVVTTVHSFGDGSVAHDGTSPFSTLVQGADGDFYGTTETGGSNTSDPEGNGYGTIFKMTPAGQVTILHSFRDGSIQNDGNEPTSGVILGSDGNFYGTTDGGGTSFGGTFSLGFGTAYKMTPSGTITILHSFVGGAHDGMFPYASLIQGRDGDFYGVTQQGGSTTGQGQNDWGFGTVYRMTPSGQITILHNFGDGSVASDGREPNGSLILGSDGNFYGTTQYGGTTVGTGTFKLGLGTIFKMTPTGQVTILHDFGDGTIPDDGTQPVAALLEAAPGSFYGTAYWGGYFYAGLAYLLSADLANLTVQPSASPAYVNQSVTLTLSIALTGISGTPSGTVTVYDGGTELGSTALAAEPAALSVAFKTPGEHNLTAMYVDKQGFSVTTQLTEIVSDSSAHGILLVQSAGSGQLSLWPVAGKTVGAAVPINRIPRSPWIAAGLADFNGDGIPDLLLRDPVTGSVAVWFLSGGTVTGTATFTETPNPALRLAGVGDFNGDGHPDLLFQDPSTGRLVIWLLNGTKVVSATSLATDPGIDWKAIGCGDFNGDGKSDILLQNSSTRALEAWYMSGSTSEGTAAVSSVPPAGWSAQAIANLTGEAEPNLVFQNAPDVAEWDLSGVSYIGSAALSAHLPSGSTVVGPH